MITEDPLEPLAIQWHGIRRNIDYRTPNIRLRQGFDGQVEYRMEENLELPEIGAGIAEGNKAAFRGLCRPFRAWNLVGDGTQGAALGYGMMPRWGGRRRAA